MSSARAKSTDAHASVSPVSTAAASWKGRALLITSMSRVQPDARRLSPSDTCATATQSISANSAAVRAMCAAPSP